MKLEGKFVDEPFQGILSHSVTCNEFKCESGLRSGEIRPAANISEVASSTRMIHQNNGVQEDNTSLANRALRGNEGLELDMPLAGIKKELIPSKAIEDICPGARKKILDSCLVNITSGIRQPSSFVGVEIDDISFTSNADNKFTLLVTPTHQYRSNLVAVSSIYKGIGSLVGRTKLLINGAEAFSYLPSNSDVKNVNYSITPSMLHVGINNCRLVYMYPDNSTEYLDFIVVKEAIKRTTAERTFRNYDGGYDGHVYLPALNYLQGNISPCFTVPEGTNSTLIKTTDYTNVPLAKYTGIQGIHIVAAGIKVLVSFDKGLTWKSLVSNSWQEVSIDNIATYGMSENDINSIVFARWLEIFKPTSLDFAIYLDNKLSYVANSNTSKLLYSKYLTSRGGNWNGSTDYKSDIYRVPVGLGITKFDYSLGASDGSDGSVYGYSNAEMAVTTTLNPKLTAVKSIVASSPRQSVTLSETYECTSEDEYLTSVQIYTSSTAYAGGFASMSIYGGDAIAHIKSITLQITPKLKTGYAFIM